MVTLVRVLIAEVALLTAVAQGLPVVSYRGRLRRLLGNSDNSKAQRPLEVVTEAAVEEITSFDDRSLRRTRELIGKRVLKYSIPKRSLAVSQENELAPEDDRAGRSTQTRMQRTAFAFFTGSDIVAA